MPETQTSPAQTTAFFLHSVAPDATFQNVQLSLNLGESCPIGQLREAWEKVVAANGALRSSFTRAATGETLRREHEAGALSWTSLDWTEVPPAEIPGRWQTLLEEDSRQPFDPGIPPLLRFQAIELPGGHCHLLVTFPRLLLDEDSLFHILCEWLEALQGVAPEPAAGSPAPSPGSPAAAEWWSRFFSGNPEPLIFGVCPRPLPPQETANRQEHGIFLDRETSRKLTSLGQRLGLPPRDAFLAVWSLVLSRLLSRDSAMLLAPSPEPGGENFLPCRILINPAVPADAWLKEVSQSETERARHAAISLERVLLLAEPSRRPREFPAAFIWSPPPLNDRIHDVFARWINLDTRIISRSQFPLSLQVRDGSRFFLQVEFDPAICPPAEAETLLKRISLIIEAILENPAQTVGALSILTETERRAYEAGAPFGVWKGESVPVEKAFAAIASRHPDVLAITDLNDAALSYSELDSHSRSLAAWLRNENLADGWNIAVCLTPTPWLPVAVLGILRAGDTCVPLDPSSAPAWLAGKLESSDVEMIVCDSRTAPFFHGLSRRILILDQQWETVAASSGGSESASQKIAFLLTGTEWDAAPGLRSLNPGLVASACQESLPLWDLRAGDRLPLLAAAGTGAFVETLLCSLIAGATLVLPNEEDPLAIIENGSPTHLRLSAGQWRALAARLQRSSTSLPASLRTVCMENTDASDALQASWRASKTGSAHGIFFFSPAGLSGASIHSTSSAIPAGEPDDSLIGFPGAGLSVSLLDPAGQPLPPHYPGRLDISFSPHETGPFSTPAWRDRTGAFHHVPMDADVPARILRQHAEIFDAYYASGPGGGATKFGAWVILRPGATTTPAELLQTLFQRLPAGLRPDFLLPVPEFPLTPGGAIHEAGLPRPAAVPATPAVPATQNAVRPSPPGRDWEPLILLHKTPDAPVIFLVHDFEGDPEKYRSLAGLLKEDWTVYGTTARGLLNSSFCHQTVETEAAALVETICLLDPDGPYHLFGYGYGAVLALEMARQLRIARRSVPYLALAGARPPESTVPDDWKRTFSRVFSLAMGKPAPPPTPAATPVALAHLSALHNYRAQPLTGSAGIILGTDMGREVEAAWTNCAPEAIVETISCPSAQMLSEPPVKRLAVMLREWVVPAGEEP